MRKSIKLAGLGIGAAGLVAGAIAGIRWFRARRADDSIDIDLSVDDVDTVDFGEPVVVAEEIVVVTEPAIDPLR